MKSGASVAKLTIKKGEPAQVFKCKDCDERLALYRGEVSQVLIQCPGCKQLKELKTDGR